MHVTIGHLAKGVVDKALPKNGTIELSQSTYALLSLQGKSIEESLAINDPPSLLLLNLPPTLNCKIAAAASTKLVGSSYAFIYPLMREILCPMGIESLSLFNNQNRNYIAINREPYE